MFRRNTYPSLLELLSAFLGVDVDFLLFLNTTGLGHLKTTPNENEIRSRLIRPKYLSNK